MASENTALKKPLLQVVPTAFQLVSLIIPQCVWFPISLSLLAEKEHFPPVTEIWCESTCELDQNEPPKLII